MTARKGRARRFGLLAALAAMVSGCDDQPRRQADLPTPIANGAPGVAPKAAPQDAFADRPDESAAAAARPFDFYVLALSWSPSYCEAEGEDANRQQCGAKRPYAFVVHGLWPQFEYGFPRDCGTDSDDVDQALTRSLYDLMPSAGLIRHEWRTHGACSGLSQDAYFDLLRRAREKIVVPPEFRQLAAYRTLKPGEAERSFVTANPGLEPAGVAVTCDRRYLRDVRICLAKDLGFRDCPEIDRRACRLDTVVMPPLRGG